MSVYKYLSGLILLFNSHLYCQKQAIHPEKAAPCSGISPLAWIIVQILAKNSALRGIGQNNVIMGMVITCAEINNTVLILVTASEPK